MKDFIVTVRTIYKEIDSDNTNYYEFYTQEEAEKFANKVKDDYRDIEGFTVETKTYQEFR